MIYFLDHHDSFSLNLLDWLTKDNQSEITYISCSDKVGFDLISTKPGPLILSPGPGRPESYPQSMAILKQLALSYPILGICLGHQMLGCLYGAALGRAKEPFHGKPKNVKILDPGLVEYSNNKAVVMTSYNSLILQEQNFPSALEVLARDENEIAAIRVKREDGLAQIGWQFHPESFLSRNVDFIKTYFFDSIKGAV